jgi:hypothetical protein
VRTLHKEIVFLFQGILGNGRTTAATNNVPLLIENLKIIAINPFVSARAIKE